MCSQPDSALHFLLFPPEVRQMVYGEILSCRVVVLRDRPPDERDRWSSLFYDYYLADPLLDDTISLLQVCREIHAEMQPLLQRYVPSHLVLSKNLQDLPQQYIIQELEKQTGMPREHLTHLSMNVSILGLNSKIPRRCPALELESWSYFSHPDRDVEDILHTVRKPPSDRLPNLDNISGLSNFLTLYLPALREVHIYDMLKHALEKPHLPCGCPGTTAGSCMCGECHCNCATRPHILNNGDLSLAQTKDNLYEALLSRYRAALPEPAHDQRDMHGRIWPSDYRVPLDLLAHGVHIFFHDEITLPIVSDDTIHTDVHNGYWHATYHLIPPEHATKPKQPSTEAVDKPRQRKMKWKEEENARMKERIANGSFIEELSTAHYPSHTRKGKLRKLPAEMEGVSLLEFEAGLHLEITDCESDIETASVKAQESKGSRYSSGTLWIWD